MRVHPITTLQGGLGRRCRLDGRPRRWHSVESMAAAGSGTRRGKSPVLFQRLGALRCYTRVRRTTVGPLPLPLHARHGATAVGARDGSGTGGTAHRHGHAPREEGGPVHL